MDKKILYALVTALSLFLGIFWVWMTPTSFTASAVLGAVQQNKGAAPGVGQISQALGLGLSLNNVSSDFGRFQELLTSKYLLQVADQKYHLADMLDIPEGAPPPTLRSAITGPIKALIGAPTVPPTRFEQLISKVQGNLEVTPQAQTETLEVAYSANSKVTAEKILNILLLEADNILKQRAAQRSKGEVDYLTRQLGTINSEGVRQSLYPSVVQSETVLLMSNSDMPFAAEILDRPFSPSLPAWPRPTWQIMIVFAAMQILFFAITGYRYLMPDRSLFQHDGSDSGSSIESRNG
jgi:uncharacterized protein involved in exopolysaccharide biosynthesis